MEKIFLYGKSGKKMKNEELGKNLEQKNCYQWKVGGDRRKIFNSVKKISGAGSASEERYFGP